MNQKTAKLLRREAAAVEVPYRQLKTEWKRRNWRERTRLRAAIKDALK